MKNILVEKPKQAEKVFKDEEDLFAGATPADASASSPPKTTMPKTIPVGKDAAPAAEDKYWNDLAIAVKNNKNNKQGKSLEQGDLTKDEFDCLTYAKDRWMRMSVLSVLMGVAVYTPAVVLSRLPFEMTDEVYRKWWSNERSSYNLLKSLTKDRSMLGAAMKEIFYDNGIKIPMRNAIATVIRALGIDKLAHMGGVDMSAGAWNWIFDGDATPKAIFGPKGKQMNRAISGVMGVKAVGITTLALMYVYYKTNPHDDTKTKNFSNVSARWTQRLLNKIGQLVAYESALERSAITIAIPGQDIRQQECTELTMLAGGGLMAGMWYTFLPRGAGNGRIIGSGGIFKGQSKERKISKEALKADHGDMARRLALESFDSIQRKIWNVAKTDLKSALEEAGVGPELLEQIMEKWAGNLLRGGPEMSIDSAAALQDALKEIIREADLASQVFNKFTELFSVSYKAIADQQLEKGVKLARSVENLAKQETADVLGGLRDSDIYRKSLATLRRARKVQDDFRADNSTRSDTEALADVIEDVDVSGVVVTQGRRALEQKSEKLWVDLFEEAINLNSLGSSAKGDVAGFSSLNKLFQYVLDVDEVIKAVIPADEITKALEDILVAQAKAGSTVDGALVVSEILSLFTFPVRAQRAGRLTKTVASGDGMATVGKSIPAEEIDIIATATQNVERRWGDWFKKIDRQHTSDRFFDAVIDAEFALEEILHSFVRLHGYNLTDLVGSELVKDLVKRALKEARSAAAEAGSKKISASAFGIATITTLGVFTAALGIANKIPTLSGEEPTDVAAALLSKSISDKQMEEIRNIAKDDNSDVLITLYRDFIFEEKVAGTNNDTDDSVHPRSAKMRNVEDLCDYFSKRANLSGSENAVTQSMIKHLKELKRGKAFEYFLKGPSSTASQGTRGEAEKHGSDQIDRVSLKNFFSRSTIETDGVTTLFPVLLINSAVKAGLDNKIKNYIGKDNRRDFSKNGAIKSKRAVEANRKRWLREEVFTIKDRVMFKEVKASLSKKLKKPSEIQENIKGNTKMNKNNTITMGDLSLIVREVLKEAAGGNYSAYPFNSHFGDEEEPKPDYMQDWKSLEMAVIRDESRGTAIDIAKVLVKDLELFNDVLDLVGRDQALGSELLRKLKEEQESTTKDHA